MKRFVCQMLNMRDQQGRKSRFAASKQRVLAIFFVTSALVSASHVLAAGLSTDELSILEDREFRDVLVDEFTGLAVGGFDPVAFFLTGRAVEGKEDLQATLGNGTYYFQNTSNRDAFLSSPQIYKPRFGGHCAMQMARGRKVAGNPQIWAVFKNRLFFFHSAQLRDEWLKSPGGYAVTAENKWGSIL